MTEVVLGLGTNLGDRWANLNAAVNLLNGAGVRVTAASSVWETPPMPEGQPFFLNAVAVAETELTPGELLTAVKRVEASLGRRPNRRWGPRPIDIDILFCGAAVVTEPDLVVPHAGIAARAFVLAPLAEVVREPLPVLGMRAVDMVARLDLGGLRRVGSLAAP